MWMGLQGQSHSVNIFVSYVKTQQKASNIEEALSIQVEVIQSCRQSLFLPALDWHNTASRASRVAKMESVHWSNNMGLHSLSLIKQCHFEYPTCQKQRPVVFVQYGTTWEEQPVTCWHIDGNRFLSHWKNKLFILTGIVHISRKHICLS